MSSDTADAIAKEIDNFRSEIRSLCKQCRHQVGQLVDQKQTFDVHNQRTNVELPASDLECKEETDDLQAMTKLKEIRERLSRFVNRNDVESSNELIED